MNKTYVVGLTALLLAVYVPCANARRLSQSNAPKAAKSEIVFTIADQQFMISDQSFDLSFTLTSGTPNQIKLEPTQAAKDSGFIVAAEWEEYKMNSVKSDSTQVNSPHADEVTNDQTAHYIIPRPNRIKPGTYACVLSMRDSLQTDSAVSAPFNITIEQISFDMERSAVLCGDESEVTIELRNIKGNPNRVKVLVLDSALKHSGIIENIDLPFDKTNPYITIDLSRVPQGIAYSQAVQVALANDDPNMQDTTLVTTYKTIVVRDTTINFTLSSIPTDTIEKNVLDTVYYQADSIVIDSTTIDHIIYAGDPIGIDDEGNTIYATTDSIVYKSDTLFHAGDIKEINTKIETEVKYSNAYIVTDTIKIPTSYTELQFPNDTTINGVFIPALTTYIDTTFENSVIIDTLYNIPAEYIVETITIDSTQADTVKRIDDIIWAAHNFALLGRGMADDYIHTKFNDCLIFVDNSGRQAGAPIFTSYQWYKNGAMVAGATEQYFYETDANGNMIPLNGTYSVSVTTSDGYNNTLCPITFNGRSNKPEQMSSIIYPNPTPNGYQPTLRTFYGEDILEESILRIYDLQGNLAYILIGLSEYNALPTLPPNMYIVHVETPIQTETIKFTVK